MTKPQSDTSTKKSQKTYEERIQELTLMNNAFMNLCFKDNIPAVQLVLRIILDKPDLIVESVRTQEWIENLEGRSVGLDIIATDSTKAPYDIEVQIDPRGASGQRSRYISSMLDKDLLDKGKPYTRLPKSYVIFITENDIFGKGNPIYDFVRINRRNDLDLNDGSIILYVNGAYQDNSALGKLMQDFHCKNPEEMHYKELKERVGFFKNTKGGKRKMTDIFEEIRQEGVEEYRSRLINRLLSKGRSRDEIKDTLDVSDEEIDKLKLTFPAN